LHSRAPDRLVSLSSEEGRRLDEHTGSRSSLPEEADQLLGVQVMENFFIALAVVAFAGLVVFLFVIEPRMKH
jgi:hypothetical protein